MLGRSGMVLNVDFWDIRALEPLPKMFVLVEFAQDERTSNILFYTIFKWIKM